MTNETTTTALTWTCEKCEAPIADGDGYLTVSLDAVTKHEQAFAEWEQTNIRHDPPGSRFGFFTGDAILTCPTPVPWQTLHAQCDPNPDTYDYWIPVNNLRTPAAILDLTAHLLEKTWLEATNYPDLLHRIATNLRND